MLSKFLRSVSFGLPRCLPFSLLSSLLDLSSGIFSLLSDMQCLEFLLVRVLDFKFGHFLVVRNVFVLTSFGRILSLDIKVVTEQRLSLTLHSIALGLSL